ncbi:MAG TPA: heparan-alpha-glucosaminide N-acetyltransferase domain-containing protein [Chitinophagaceae bacterium]|nr:heparan-alpha-glucosaminide N-acetyltransferase domain-containing protein [Chitinophagaceae bacterium]
MKRVLSIDIVRGLVMIIMALDHTRDLIHVDSIIQQPTDLLTTNPALFFTRWITHLCAPTFVFLSGTSAYISFKNKKNIDDTRRFLLSRGLWLIIVEFTLVNFGVWFDIHFNVFLFDVIATIGFGFIILSLFLKTSIKTIAITGLAIIFLHNLVPLAPSTNASLFEKILITFFSPGAFPFGGGRLFVMGYPPVPWLGIMLIGFTAGKLFELPVAQRKSIFLKIGVASLILFIIIRAINIYGDPFPFTKQKNSLFTFLSFMNITKYPPSLIFCLVTLGIMFILLSCVEGMKNKFTEITIVYGKVPLFYFIIHWYILHPIMFLIVFLQGYKSADLLFGFNLGRPKGLSGVNLWYTYLIWIGVVIMLYPLCKWYGRYKENHKEKKWLRYL